MQGRIWTVLVVAAAFMATAAWAADVTGTWSGELAISGNQATVTYTFQQDGERLTGSARASQGDGGEIKEGKVQGDKVSFVVETGSGRFVHEGSIAGDEIRLNLKSDTGLEGSVTLKKEK